MQNVQASIDDLTSKLKAGNMNPRKGNKPIGSGISEARHDSGARFYFWEIPDAIEILGKSSRL